MSKVIEHKTLSLETRLTTPSCLQTARMPNPYRMAPRTPPKRTTAPPRTPTSRRATAPPRTPTPQRMKPPRTTSRSDQPRKPWKATTLKNRPSLRRKISVSQRKSLLRRTLPPDLPFLTFQSTGTQGERAHVKTTGTQGERAHVKTTRAILGGAPGRQPR